MQHTNAFYLHGTGTVASRMLLSFALRAQSFKHWAAKTASKPPRRKRSADEKGVKDTGKRKIQLEAEAKALHSVGEAHFLPALTPDTAQMCR